MKITELLKGKAGLFFIVNAIASIGMNIGIVGVSWFIINTTKQNEVLGIYGAIALISSFLTLISAGSLTDKYNKVAIMKYCCLGQGSLFFLTAILYLLNVPVLYIIYGLAVLNMPCMVIFSTVSRGAIPAVWDKSELSKGNSIIEVTIQLGAMFAAILTGFVYHIFGFSVLIFTGALLSCLAFIILSLTKYSFEYELPSKEGFLENIKQGVSYLKNRGVIFFFGLVVFVPTIVISASNTVIPGYVEQYLGRGAITFGLGDMVFAIGAVISGFMISKLVVPARRGLWQGLMFIVAIISLLLFMMSKNIYWFFSVIFFTGISLAGLRVLLTTTLMEVVEGKYLGRCLSLLMAVSVIVQALLSFFIGFSMDRYGIFSGYLILIGVMALGFVGFMLINPAGNNIKSNL